ncbi:MAG: N-acetylmuramoyl-L-alanine amidase [Prevotella sp.]|nr:N-acetylmuramoyl-L-alanine amidase [Prevotella sp.]
MRKLLSIIVLLLCFGAAQADNKKFTLVIDAGHGGKDSGTCGKYSKEKSIALKTALAFGRYVENNCPDVKVIYTRKTDVFIELKERAAIANRNHADLFISIHVNSVESRKPVTGIEVYSQGMRRSDEKLSAAKRENSVILLEKDYRQNYQGYDPNSPESDIIFGMMFDKHMEKSVELSSFIHSRMSSHAGRSGRVKQDNFAVLRLTALPACLVELGYITTPSEEQYMNSDANLEKMAYAIFLAFQDYRHKYDDTAVPPYKPVNQREPEVASEPSEGAMPEPLPATQPDVAVNAEPGVQEQPAVTATSDAPPVIEGFAALPQPAANAPVFKVQFLVGKNRLKAGDSQLKGVTGFDYYEEGGMLKYTYGASTDYNEVSKLRKELSDRFPQAFIVAFKDGKRVDVQQAIQEFKNNKKQ